METRDDSQRQADQPRWVRMIDGEYSLPWWILGGYCMVAPVIAYLGITGRM